MKKIILILSLLVCSTAFGADVKVRDGKATFTTKDSSSHTIPVEATLMGNKRYDLPDLGNVANCSVSGTELGWCSGNVAHGVAEAYAVPKELSDGTWVMYFHVYIVLTAAVANWNFEVNGVDFQNSGVLASYCASTNTLGSPGTSNAHLEGGQNVGRTVCSGSRAYRNVSGWVTLEGKPQWVK